MEESLWLNLHPFIPYIKVKMQFLLNCSPPFLNEPYGRICIPGKISFDDEFLILMTNSLSLYQSFKEKLPIDQCKG